MTVDTDNPVALAQQLIQIPSVTPEDLGCQTLIADFLKPLGFECTTLNIEEVTNLWARRGDKGPFIVFAGHTDVVPTGPESQWKYPPFSATLADDGFIYGRGSADMKSSIACFMVACRRFLQDHPTVDASIGFLITSDEEGPALHGTKAVIEHLKAKNIQFDYCIVGEPSSDKKLGDSIKNGRRGSLSGRLTVKGVQGHIAYPELAENPIHCFSPALNDLVTTVWDYGNDYFPPTSFQISNIHSGTGATNVIPGDCMVDFNFRFSTEQTPDTLKNRVHEILNDYQFNYDLDWTLSGLPFITQADGDLIRAVQTAVNEKMGYQPKLSTAGGTSDGRFIAPTGAEVIELGPLNDTIHKVDERVSAADLTDLTDIYYLTLQHLLVK